MYNHRYNIYIYLCLSHVLRYRLLQKKSTLRLGHEGRLEKSKRRLFSTSNGKFEHVPNLVIAHKVCEMCVDEAITTDSTCQYCETRCPECSHFDKENKCFTKEPCEETCGFRKVMFRGENVKQEFGRWLFSKHNKNYTALAHNMKGYVGYFLLEYLVDYSILPQVIYSGSKLMYIHVAKQLNIRILDS